MIETDSDYLAPGTSVLSTTATSIAIPKGSAVSVITNIGSPVGNRRLFSEVADIDVLFFASKYQRPVYTPYKHNAPTIE